MLTEHSTIMRRLWLDGEDAEWSGSSAASARIRRALDQAYGIMKRADLGARYADCALVIGEDVAWIMGTSREMRDLRDLAPPQWRLADWELVPRAYGLPFRLYGLRIAVNPWQPFGTADLVCGNTIVSMEPIK